VNGAYPEFLLQVGVGGLEVGAEGLQTAAHLSQATSTHTVNTAT